MEVGSADQSRPGVILMKETVLVTGGSSGIGRATVKEFAEAGFTVWFTYHTGEERAVEIRDELSEFAVRPFHVELGDQESHRRLMSGLPGPVGILINNAGLGSKTVEKLSKDTYEQDATLMRVNAMGTLWLTRDLLPAMEEHDFGKIVLLSSVGGGVTHFPGFRLADGMSKAALAYMGRHLQARYSHRSIDIFTLCPGAVETPMFEASTLAHLKGDARRRLIESLPGGRLIDPAEGSAA